MSSHPLPNYAPYALFLQYITPSSYKDVFSKTDNLRKEETFYGFPVACVRGFLSDGNNIPDWDSLTQALGDPKMHQQFSEPN